MRKIIATLFLIVLLAGTAVAGPLYTESATATGATAAYAAIPPVGSMYPAVKSLWFEVTDAGADITIYEGDSTNTTLANAESAGATALTLTSCTGLDNNDVLVIYNTSADVFEAVVMSACDDTTEVATVGALTGSYRSGAKVYEMKSLLDLQNVGSGSQLLTGDPIIAGEKGKPLAVKVNPVSGTAKLLAITVEYR